MRAPIRILHAHSTFAHGGKEARAVRLMNAFGDRARHTVLSAVPGELGAREAIAPGIAVSFPDDAPLLAGRPGPARLRALARYAAGFDLVLTYNWGACDMAMALRLFGRVAGAAPLIHHEDGFNADEAARRRPARNLYRRIAFGAARRLAVPSATLERIAREEWSVPPDRLVRIANGVPVTRFATPPAPDAVPGLVRRPGELVVGTVAGLRAVKNLPRLVRAFAASGIEGSLVIVGEGPERGAIADAARAAGVEDRLVMPGFLPDPAAFLGLFDIFALSSDSEQWPLSLAEAMAAGLPVAAPGVGDIAAMVAPSNQLFVTPPGDDAALAAALSALAADPALRRALGSANRARAAARFDEGAMIAAWAALYEGTIGRPGALRP